MLLRRTPKKEKRVSLKGAVQINRNSYFVYADEGGKTFLNTGEHIQKYAVKRMMSLNPSIEALLKQYKIKPEIHIKTLKELTGGHMNETCNIAEGVFSMLSEDLKRDLDKSIIKEALSFIIILILSYFSLKRHTSLFILLSTIIILLFFIFTYSICPRYFYILHFQLNLLD